MRREKSPPGSELKIKKLKRELENLSESMKLSERAYQTKIRFMSVLQEEKSRQEKFLQMLLDNSIDIMFLLDRDARISYCTKAFLDYYNIPHIDMIRDRDFIDVVNQYLGEKSAKKVALFFSENKDAVTPEHYELFHKRPGEKEDRIFHLTVTSIFEDGEVYGYVFISHEATEIVRAREQAERANAAKTNFLASMSHEIRTPMHAVVGMCELALRETGNPLVTEYLHDIKQAGNNLLLIINDVLDLSKIESGKLQIVETPYEFCSLINDAFSIMRIYIKDKPVQLLAEIDSRIPRLLLGDAGRVRQVLNNLFGNAVKYTRKGFVKVCINCKEDAGVCRLFIEVSDSGIGIKEEDTGKLFKKFVRLNVEENAEVEGTGLGLPITRSICEAMGGRISVKSEYGKGSVFTAEIVQKTLDSRPMAELEKPESVKILYFCEDPLLSASFGWTLDNLGIPALAAENKQDLAERLVSGLWNYVFFPDDCITLMHETISRSKLDITPVLLGSVSPGKSKGWNGLSVVYPYYAVSIVNAIAGKKIIHRRNGDKNFNSSDFRILVVDDLDINLKIAKGLLAPYKMQVVLCKSSVKALKMIREDNFDLIFLDKMMPEMDGDELVRHVRSTEDAKNRDIPIIAMTANAAPGMRKIFLENGYSDYISKPFDLYQLNELLERWIGRNKRRDMEGQDTILLGIKDLDENAGMANCFHSREKYRELLCLYCGDMDYRLGLLRTAVNSKKEILQEQKTHVFSNLHIIKSACMAIGANTYAKMAYELEQGQGDMIRLSLFTEDLAAFRETILQTLQSA